MSDVSVIIPVYNCEEFIEEALHSIFAQTFPINEIIVMDDGSDDGTAAILKKYAGRIKYYYQKNRGLAAARNAGIQVSSSSYLAFLDADDFYHPEKIAIQKAFLDDHPEIDMVFSDFEYFGGTLLRRPIPDSFKKGKGSVFLDLFRYNCIAIPTVLIRRKCFEEIGLFDETLLAVEDYDFWLRLSKHKRIGYIDRVLAKVRLHPENMSKDAERMCQYEIKVINKVIDDHLEIKDHYPYLIKGKYAIIYFESGYRFFLDHRMREARQKFLYAMKSQPLWIKPYIYFLASYGGSRFIKMVRKVKRFFPGKE